MKESLKSAILERLDRMSDRQLEDVLKKVQELARLENFTHRRWKQAALRQIRTALANDTNSMMSTV